MGERWVVTAAICGVVVGAVLCLTFSATPIWNRGYAAGAQLPQCEGELVGAWVGFNGHLTNDPDSMVLFCGPRGWLPRSQQSEPTTGGAAQDSGGPNDD